MATSLRAISPLAKYLATFTEAVIRSKVSKVSAYAGSRLFELSGKLLSECESNARLSISIARCGNDGLKPSSIRDTSSLASSTLSATRHTIGVSVSGLKRRTEHIITAPSSATTVNATHQIPKNTDPKSRFIRLFILYILKNRISRSCRSNMKARLLAFVLNQASPFAAQISDNLGEQIL